MYVRVCVGLHWAPQSKRTSRGFMGSPGSFWVWSSVIFRKLSSFYWHPDTGNKKGHVLDFTHLSSSHLMSGNNDQHLPTFNLRISYSRRWIFCLLAPTCSSAVAPLAVVGSGSDLPCSLLVVSSSSGWPLLSTSWLMSTSHRLPAVTFVHISSAFYDSNYWVLGIVVHGFSTWNQTQIQRQLILIL